jgi:hypothetical protein
MKALKHLDFSKHRLTSLSIETLSLHSTNGSFPFLCHLADVIPSSVTDLHLEHPYQYDNKCTKQVLSSWLDSDVPLLIFQRLLHLRTVDFNGVTNTNVCETVNSQADNSISFVPSFA